MLIRVIASFIIIIGCTYVGIYFGEKLSLRAKQLATFQSALEILKFNILFLNLPLAEALYKVSKSQPGVVSRIFRDMSLELSRDNGKTVQNAWEMSIAKERRELNLLQEDIVALNEFASRLGSGDRTDQTGNIDITAAKLSIFESEAREVCKKNCRLYKGLGILAGLLIVVLLI
ncbi:MAG: stage III sporulation protein AB [Oscillospiraceae bacterium]|nr:stage III sporulation protein AB [Oscillospiraceae bacterium]